MTTASDPDPLGALLDELARATADRPAIAARAARLTERARTRRFHVAVLGEFKRGKSTLVNALVGGDVLPTGVLPVTAVAVEVGYGPPGATVVGLDGTRTDIPLEGLAEFCTERANPGNRRQVDRVEVRVPAPLLATGLVLVDTPGIGSVHAHNTTAALAALDDADGGIVVLAADAPLSAGEQDLLSALAGRRATTFVVLNKADRLTRAELDEVRTFVDGLTAGAPVGLTWCISVRPGASPSERFEFDALAAALDRFARDQLDRVRSMSLCREALALLDRLEHDIELERAVLALDEANLAKKRAAFRDVSARERTRFEDTALALRARLGDITDALADRLARFAAQAPDRHAERLVAAATGADAVQALRDETERIVHDELDAALRTEEATVATAWRSLAERFRSDTTERIDTLRHAAADLFAIRPFEVEVPDVDAQPERFTYLFDEPISLSEPVFAAARHLLPDRVRRRRALAAERQRLADELDKHAGRARVDLTERLHGACEAFIAAMRDAVDSVTADIDRTVERAARLHEQGAAAAAEHERRVAALEGLIAEVRTAAAAVGRPADPDAAPTVMADPS